MKRMKLNQLLRLIGMPLLLVPTFVSALTAEEVYQRVKDSVQTVYSIDFQSQSIKGRGSAVAIGKTILATNCHVALFGDYTLIKLNDQIKPRVARLFYKNEKEDLCFLEIPDANFSAVHIRPTASTKIGEVVFAVGNPKGTEKTISQGIISNKHQFQNGTWLQTDAAIYFGSSGGGLFDEKANLVGITTKMGGNFGFALPTEWIIQVMSPSESDKTEVESAPVKPDQAPKSDQPDPPKTDAPKAEVKPQSNGADGSGPAEKSGNLAYLGTYGDQIELYRNNQECFLFIPGQDSSGNRVSSLLWNPKYETTVVVFPKVSHANEALAIIYQAASEKSDPALSTAFRSDSILYISDQPYPLYGTTIGGKKYDFLVSQFSQSPRTALLNSGSFKIVYKDTHSGAPEVTIVYYLKGFAEALSSYNAQCE